MSERRRPSWQATPAVALASAGPLAAYSTPIDMTDVWLGAALALAAVAAAVTVARAMTRSRVIPTLVGLVVALLLVVSTYAQTSGLGSVLPTPAALRSVWRVLDNGIQDVLFAPVPLDATDGVRAVVTVLVLIVFLVAEHLAVAWRAAGMAGAPLLLPWLPAALIPFDAPVAALLGVLAIWLAIMALTSDHADVSRVPPAAAWLPAAAAIVGLAALVAPLAPHVPGWGALPRAQGPSDGSATRLNLNLDLRDALTSQASSRVLTYTTTGEHVDVLRLYTATEFTGAEWNRDRGDVAGGPADLGVLWPSVAEGWDTATLDSVEISIDTLAETALPITTVPRTVDVDDAWRYDGTYDEVRSATSSTAGLSYSLVYAADWISAERLAAASGEDPGDEYLRVPDALDSDRVGALARQIAADASATSRYEIAVALQQYLRDPTEFVYDTSAVLTGGDAVSAFLDSRRGYCQQFATTMVMMARLMDIPARIGVGFLGGSRDPDGLYTVVGGNAHAWPELYFPGTGWVRFEPTPAVQTGAPPEYSAGSGDDGSEPSPTATAEPSSEPSASATPSATVSAPATPTPTATTPTGEAGAASGGSPFVWVFLLGGLAGAAALVVWLTVRRDRRAGTAHVTPVEGAWSRLRAGLPEPWRWPDAMTPYEAATHVRMSAAEAGSPLTDGADASLMALVTAIVEERYLPEGFRGDVTALEGDVDAVLSDVRQRPQR